MGAGSSKPEQHVFAADSPVRFSQSVIDSLQNSPETDSTRSRNLELQVQARVTAELERIREQEAQHLEDMYNQLGSDSPSPSTSEDQSSPSITEKITDALTPSSSKPERSHTSVSKEIQELKSKLEKRKHLEKMDPAVQSAKERLVQCLRQNDRRPLDCWQEVENFKTEVAKLEKKFVDRAVR